MSNSRPSFIDPWTAAKVSTFMEAAEQGRWKIIRFTITEKHAEMSYLMALAEGGTQEEREMRANRTIPPGTYISLQRLATESEMRDVEELQVVDAHAADGDSRYLPVMSDTPTEIREHYRAIEDAEGDVVITGLGLGCIVSALLAKPTVKTVTVVEIDRDVIALTGPYYADNPRVKIVNMDAIAAASHFLSEGVYFDYAWHDIWSHISDRNLYDDDLAEHGISYETMFTAYGDICDVQEAWAWHEARAMDYFKSKRRHEMRAWAETFVAGDADERLKLLHRFHAVQLLPQYSIADDIPADVLEFVIVNMHVREATAQQIERRGGLDQMASEVLAKAEEALGEDHDPMGRPNEVPEANVAR